MHNTGEGRKEVCHAQITEALSPLSTTRTRYTVEPGEEGEFRAQCENSLPRVSFGRSIDTPYPLKPPRREIWGDVLGKYASIEPKGSWGREKITRARVLPNRNSPEEQILVWSNIRKIGRSRLMQRGTKMNGGRRRKASGERAAHRRRRVCPSAR